MFVKATVSGSVIFVEVRHDHLFQIALIQGAAHASFQRFQFHIP